MEISGKQGAADAHDAGLVGPYKKNWGQLMLMMLARFGHGGKPGATDAHDAGRAGPCAGDQWQLMLMMLARLGHVGKARGS